MAIEIQTTSLETIKLSELPEAIALNESDYSLIVQNGTSKKIKGLLLKGNAGDNGKSIEIQKTDTHIQWRQEEGQWIDLIALVDLKGDRGEQGLQGEKGEKGDTGEQGPQGIQGEQGPQGEVGPQGPKGDTGNDGYTPVKGVDYFDGAKGEKGDKGDPGENGRDGLTTQVSVNGTTYTHANGLITLPNYPTVPTKTSQLTNDSGYATETYVTSKIAEASLSGGEVDLSGYATKDELNAKADATHTHTVSDITNLSIPSKTSQLTNDSNFITINDVHTHSNKTVLDGITAQKVTSWDNKSNFSGSYNDLTNKPTIPAEYTHPSTHPVSMITGLATIATSGNYNDLTNKPTIPSEYNHPSTHPASMITGLATVATSGSYNDLSNKPTIPSKTSQLTNDSDFTTKTYVDSKVDSKTVTTLTSATTVTLTTARQQYLKATRNITLKLPTISTTTDITEIHFYYTAASVYTITFSDSNIKWQSATPTIEANKYYEFIFTRLHDGTWLAGVIVYA